MRTVFAARGFVVLAMLLRVGAATAPTDVTAVPPSGPGWTPEVSSGWTVAKGGSQR